MSVVRKGEEKSNRTLFLPTNGPVFDHLARPMLLESLRDSPRVEKSWFAHMVKENIEDELAKGVDGVRDRFDEDRVVLPRV